MNRVVHAGELVSTDDPAYKNNKESFEEIETHFDYKREMKARAARGQAEAAPVEQATSAPGEKRVTPVRPAAAPVKVTTASVKAEEKKDEK